jgi:hypothetical protein
MNFLYMNLLQLEDSLLFAWLDYRPVVFLFLILSKVKYITYQLGRQAHLSSTSLQIQSKKHVMSFALRYSHVEKISFQNSNFYSAT